MTAEVCLEIMKLDNVELNKMYPNCFNYFYGMAYRMYHFTKSSFFNTYRRELMELQEFCYIPEEPFNRNEYLIDLGLDATERLWIRTCSDHDFNYVWMASKTKISRGKISERINDIKNKYGSNS